MKERRLSREYTLGSRYWNGPGWYWLVANDDKGGLPSQGMHLGECMYPDELDREISICINDCMSAHRSNPEEYTGLASGFYVVREIDEDGNLPAKPCSRVANECEDVDCAEHGAEARPDRWVELRQQATKTSAHKRAEMEV